MWKRVFFAIALCAVLFADGLAFAGTLTLKPLAAEPDAAQAPDLTRDDLEAWCDGFFPYALRQSDIAGAVVAVVKDGAVLFEKGYGYADLSKKLPMDPLRTEVHVGSVSKVFTWTAVMQLVEQHRINLNEDINQYLDFRIPAAFGEPVTMRELMTHTAGFEELLEEYASRANGYMPLGPYMETVPAPTRIFPPGKVIAYSNYGANLAGYIVQRLSGEPFDVYVDNNIFRPLGMLHSTFTRPVPAYIRGALAKHYGVASSGTSPGNDWGPSPWPAGGLVTTADDVARFMLAQLQGGSLGTARILRAYTVR